jgi:hypothetical protein
MILAIEWNCSIESRACHGKREFSKVLRHKIYDDIDAKN